MGCVSSKSSAEKKQLRARIYLLEEEIRRLKHKREQESKAHEQCTAMVISKEAEWKKEREKFMYECGMLRKKLEEEEDEKGRRKVIEECYNKIRGKVESDGWFLVEQMRVEQARREETMEKWKQLYLSIKTELDDLIRRTGQGVSLWCGREEEMIDVLQRELKAREEILEEMRRRLSTMEREGAKREREIDILKQSLRILNGNNNNNNDDSKQTCRRGYKASRLQRAHQTK